MQYLIAENSLSLIQLQDGNTNASYMENFQLISIRLKN